MGFGVAVAIWCRTCDLGCDLLHEQKIERDSCRTPNRRCSKSHMRFTANRTWNRTRNRSCNRPLTLVTEINSQHFNGSSWKKPLMIHISLFGLNMIVQNVQTGRKLSEFDSLHSRNLWRKLDLIPHSDPLPFSGSPIRSDLPIHLAFKGRKMFFLLAW
jgi:hypothetical protein